MSWDRLVQQLDRVGQRVGELADASDTANEKINDAKENLRGLQSQMRGAAAPKQITTAQPPLQSQMRVDAVPQQITTAQPPTGGWEAALNDYRKWLKESTDFQRQPSFHDLPTQPGLQGVGGVQDESFIRWYQAVSVEPGVHNITNVAPNRQAWADFMISEAQKRGGGHITNDLVQLIDDRVNQRINSTSETQRQQAGLSDADIRDINNRLSELQRLRS